MKSNTKKTFIRRIERLEKPRFQHESEFARLGEIILERRRKRAIAEGREPEPDLPVSQYDCTSGSFSLADRILEARKRRRQQSTPD
jgi:hypothetical protein